MFFLYFIFGLCLFIAGYLARCWWQIIEKPKKMAKKDVTDKTIQNTVMVDQTASVSKEQIPASSELKREYEKWLGV